MLLQNITLLWALHMVKITTCQIVSIPLSRTLPLTKLSIPSRKITTEGGIVTTLPIHQKTMYQIAYLNHMWQTNYQPTRSGPNKECTPPEGSTKILRIRNFSLGIIMPCNNNQKQAITLKVDELCQPLPKI